MPRYNKYNELEKQEEPVQEDFFADDELEEEAGEYSDTQSAPSTVLSKMNDLRSAVNAKRESLRKTGVLERPSPRGEITSARVGRRRSAAPLGVLFTLLALIGCGTIIYLAASGISSIVNDESRLHKYDDIITPIAYFDPEPFETWQDPKTADDLLLISIWDVLEKNQDTFAQDDATGRTIIPTDKVTENAQKLFGPDIRLNFAIFSDAQNDDGTAANPEDSPCIWDEETGTVKVLMTSFEGYKPKVLKISKKKDTQVCTVAYVASYASDGTMSKENTYSKVRTYILKKNPSTKKYYVAAIREA
jgi:hypothetical protein